MPAGVADILCITQITFIIVHNALLANYRWFWLTHLEVFTYFATLEHRLKSVINFNQDALRKTHNWTTTNSETRNKEKEIRKQTNYAILRPNRGFLLRNQKSEKIPNRFLKSILQNQKTNFPLSEIRYLKTKIRNPFEILNNQDALRPIRFRKSEIRNRYYLWEHFWF